MHSYPHTSLATRILAAVMVIFMSPAIAEETPSAALDVGLVNPGYAEKPDWFANSFLDIREDLG